MHERVITKEHTRLIVVGGFLSVFALMALVTWLSMATLQSVNAEMAMLVRGTDRKITRAFQMRDAVRLRTASVRSLQQIDDPTERDTVFAHLVRDTASYEDARRELVSFGANARERTILDDIALADGRVGLAYDRVNDLVYAMSPQPDALRGALAELRLQELVLLNALSELIGLERTLTEEALAANQLTYKDTRRLLLALVVAAFALSLLISALVIMRVARANRRIEHLASHDDLTGLHNRRAFEERLSRALATVPCGADAGCRGLLYLDLDRFKIVNDTCGHQAGDQLLIELARALGDRLGQEDVLARVGGDEFAVIARGECAEDLRALAEELRETVAAHVFEYADQTFQVSLSAGLVSLDDTAADLESVLADADSACYVAKRSGRNRVHVASRDDREVVRYRSDIAGVRSIRRALAEERLTLHFQPVFGIEPHGVSMAHCEVLLRIRSETGELLSPARFIPIAEKYNVMPEIDRWVFEHVADWLAAHAGAYRVPRLLINLSGVSFTDDAFCDLVVERLERGDVDPADIAFEITETAAVGNLDEARRFVERVRALGCRFALDDFGSGFSTFAYLKRMPVDYLKIDGSLVRNLVTDSVDREMVRAINQIGHTVGALTVAEFVEDDATLQCLREMGVDYAQGYGLRLPSPLTELVDELEPLAEGGARRRAS